MESPIQIDISELRREAMKYRLASRTSAAFIERLLQIIEAKQAADDVKDPEPGWTA